MTHALRIPALVAAAALVAVTCTPFATRYERIEPDKVRPLSVVYSPLPEAAPGDTVRLRLYCAPGDSVVSARWQMSYDVIRNDYGDDTAINRFDLPVIAADPHFPDSADVTFVVPESTFHKTVALSYTLGYVRPLLPPAMQSLTQSQLAGLVDDFASLDITNPAAAAAFISRWGTALGTTSPDSLLATAGLLASLFSLKIYIFGEVASVSGRTLAIRSTFVVRYNSRLAANPLAAGLVSVNRNPSPRWLGIYRVRKDSLYLFNPRSDTAGEFDLTYLVNAHAPDSVRDTIVIDTGCSYFAAVDSGIVRVNDDTGRVTPVVLKDSGTVFLKSAGLRVWFTIGPGDTVRLPAVLRSPRLVRCLPAAPKGRSPIFSLRNAGDTIIAVGPGDSIRVDTSWAAAGAPVAPAWVTMGRSSFDLFATTRDVGVVSGGSAGVEDYYCDWFYENVDAAAATRPLDSLLAVIPMGMSVVPILPSQDTAMHRARLWVVVYDNFFGEPNRPVGFAQLGASVYFTYTKAYAEKMGKRR